MERRICKLCLKSFSNGRALGGHMRSHMMISPIPPKIQQLNHHQLNREINNEINESASSSSSDEGILSYGLRENPKRSFRLVDPEFSNFPVSVDAAGSSSAVIVQDRESETESSKNPIRRRSKRNRKSNTTTGSGFFMNHHKKLNQPKLKKPKSSIKAAASFSSHHQELVQIEPEPVSSVSDTTPEEDVALCLMMLSRASWVSKQEEEEDIKAFIEEEEESKSIEESDDDEEFEEEKLKFVRGCNRGKYQCGTCKKVFRSYQALGGHRASHKKIRGCNNNNNNDHNNTWIPSSRITTIGEVESELGVGEGNAALPSTSNTLMDRKIHECPVCFRVFGSGQALGGHKRSHISASSTPISNLSNRAIDSNSNKFGIRGQNLIDLNLPAPIDDDDDDDYSQIELSAVSDAEFIDPIN